MKLNRKAVEEAFENATSQSDYLMSVFRMVFPRWDDIVGEIKGWPTINENTSKAIFRLAMDADKRIAPNAFPGGAWMNYGFSTLNGGKLKDWEVSLDDCKVQYRELANA